MADFMDREADVGSSDEDSVVGGGSGSGSSGDERGSERNRPPSSASNRQRTPTKKKAKTVISSDEDEEDEEEDEEKAKEEMKGFIADDDDEERSGRSGSGSGSGSDSGGESASHRKKKKRRPRRSRSGSADDIDEEDMELLQENLGIKFQKKRKRIKMDSGSEDDEDRDRSRLDDSREDDGDLPDPDNVQAQGEGDGDGYESEDVNDFIVDEDGQPIKRDRKQKKKHIFTDSARQMAEDIFGVAFDYDEFEKYDGDEYESDEDEDEDDEDDEERQEAKQRKKMRRKKQTKTIFDIYEPGELERGHFTKQDNEIRNIDVPERMQLRSVPVTAVPEGSDELDREAEWIFKHGFTKATVSRQEDYTPDNCADWARKSGTTEKIKKALDFMRMQFHEVPFIAFYRKEYVSPELEIGDLWRVYKMDELWCKLQSRKKNLRKLAEKMQRFQGDTIMADPEAPLPAGTKIIGNEDLDKIDAIETFEELKDRDQHFKLYHGQDLEPMQEMFRRRRRDRKEARKIKRRVKKRKTKVIEVTDDEAESEYEEIEEEASDEDADKDDDDDQKEARKIKRRVKKRKTKEVEVTDDEAESEYEEIEEEASDEDADKDDDDDLDDDQDILKHAKRNDPYSLCRKYGLDGFALRFGLSAENFGENLHDGYHKVDVEQDPMQPLEVAAEFVCEKFPKGEDIVTAAKYMMAAQIARDPLVRKVTREAFFERGKIDVIPTNKGKKEIDENHDCHPFKYLKDKPVRDLQHEEWLILTQAEERQEVTIEVAHSLSALTGRGTFLDEAKDFFNHDAVSATAKAWNGLRSEVIDMAFKNMLFPMLRKELRLKLTREGKDGIIRACMKKLSDWIKISKYAVSFEEEDEDDWDSSHGCRVMSIMYDEDDVNLAAYGVVITAEGEVGDLIKLEHITKRKNAWNERDAQAKMSDLDSLRQFILQKKPHVIVIGVANRKALDIQQDVQDILQELMHEEQFPRIDVHIMDDNLAKVYSNSQRAEQDFRNYPPVLRQAISIGRRMQDPLVEFSQLTGPDNEILCLRYHPMQDLLSEEELLEGLTTEFINRTNEVGVDINECVAHPHMSNLVQFIGGLGPRKGTALLKTLRMQSSQRLENRQQLVTQCHMGPKVLINCAGFIKIDTTRLGDSEVYVEVLDGSRIHNEAYEWARKMAVDALEYDEDDGNPANALEEILQDPEKLAELDLDAFAQELERQGFGKKHITLQDIRSELHSMYKDLRDRYEPPNAEEVFNMVTKETPKTFYVGKLVQAVITGFQYKKPQQDELDQAAPMRIGDENLWQCPFCGQDDFRELAEVWHHFDAKSCPGKATGVRFRLDNGITGFIPMKNLSDKTVMNPEERVQVRQNIHCRIIAIQPERFSVMGICKSSALMDKEGEYKKAKDDFYDQEREERDNERESEAKKAKERQTYIKRVIVHPSFYNIGFKEAERLMVGMDQGDVVIRPSSKGEDRLTVTWKVHDNIYQHIDVREEGKVNAFSLGQSLWIRNEEFEDLDEIIARHVNPMAAHARDVVAFKYHRDCEGGKKEKVEDEIKKDKRAQPGKIHYILSASREFPGKFMLSYMPRNKVRHELVTVTPDGFRFRQQNFDGLNMLMKWFKEHFRDPIPGTPMSATPSGRASGRTPYMTGTPGAGGPITPGAMSMAAGTPYGTTPGGTTAAAMNTPYTPSGMTPFMTPYQTPGHSAATPRSTAHAHMASGGVRIPPYGHPAGGVGGGSRGGSGTGTPRGMGGLTPGRQPPLPPSRQAMPPPPASGGGYTPGGTPSGRTPRSSSGMRPAPYPSPSGYAAAAAGHRSHQSPAGGGGRPAGGTPREAEGWAAAADAWARGGRSNRSTPREGGATPRGYGGGVTPRMEEGAGARQSGSRTPKGSGARRTPKANGADATPLYDEN